jgi:hypothetical protein
VGGQRICAILWALHSRAYTSTALGQQDPQSHHTCICPPTPFVPSILIISRGADNQESHGTVAQLGNSGRLGADVNGIYAAPKGRMFNVSGEHSARLAANSSYRRKPVSRKSYWIPCQARNDGSGDRGRYPAACGGPFVERPFSHGVYLAVGRGKEGW